MKITSLLFAVCIPILVFTGCKQKPADAPPPGNFKLVVDDILKDDNYRLATLKVFSEQPGWLRLGLGDVHRNGSYGELLVSTKDKLRESQGIFIVSRLADSRSSSAQVQTSLQVKATGGDGDMLVQGSFQAGGTTIYTIPKGTRLENFATMTASNGIYPLDVPLEIGRINGQPVTLQVGDPKK